MSKSKYRKNAKLPQHRNPSVLVRVRVGRCQDFLFYFVVVVGYVKVNKVVKVGVS